MTTLDWARLIPLGRKLLIWAAFFSILYVVRDLFALVFVTFILSFMSYRITEAMVRRVNISRGLALVVVYFLLLLSIGGATWIVVPRVVAEGKQFAAGLPALEQNITQEIDKFRLKYAELAPFLQDFGTHEFFEEFFADNRNALLGFLRNLGLFLVKGLSTIGLSIIFSFLIVWDLARLRQEIEDLSHTRLRRIFQETAGPVMAFGQTVGRAFEAQTLIALLNTVLTILGLLALGIPKIALLGLIVFIFSFLPVLGVFISSVPIVLVAFNSSGIGLAVAAVVMIIVVHMVEAYVLNPRIYALHMKLNPVLTLIVLFVGHHFFGVWGMLLGIPVASYFITHVAGLTRKAKAEPSSHPAPAPATP